ncbi:MAG: YIP1 family protein [Saccharofermentanales bacterium]
MLIIILSGIISASSSASAVDVERITRSSDKGYNYDPYGHSVPAPNAYAPLKSVGSTEIPGGLNSPSDIYVYRNEIYILDNGNNRIVVLDDDLNFVRAVIPAHEAGIMDGYGLFVHADGNIYITLYEQKSILVADPEGNVLKVIGQPVSPLIPKGMAYRPKRLGISSDDKIYLVAEGVYYGIIQMDADGNFQRFFASNTVEPGLKTFFSTLYKKIFTNEQQRKIARILPYEYSSIDIDDKSFIFSTVAADLSSSGQVKKHNPAGENILGRKDPSEVSANVIAGTGKYGDHEINLTTAGYVTSLLNDISVDSRGFIFVLDTSRNKIFNYDQENNLLSVFGTEGNVFATLSEPAAIDALGDLCLVLDRKMNSLTAYAPTKYGLLLRDAVSLYSSQQYEAANNIWVEISEINNNLNIAHDGIAKASLGRNEYRTAMDHFEIAKNKTGYNEAFLQNRTVILNRIAPFLFVFLAVLLAGIWIILSRSTRKAIQSTSKKEITHDIRPGYAMIHPIDAFERIKSERKGNAYYAGIVIVLIFAFRLISLNFTGFLFNSTNPLTINFAYELLQFALLFLVFTLCAHAVSSFIDGKAFYRETFIVCAFALLPYGAALVLSTALSHFLSLDEAVFFTLINQIGVYWSAVMIFTGLMKVNSYSFKKTVFSFLLIIIMILFVIFLLVLAYSLVMQFATFIEDIIKEIQYRT